MTCPEVCPGPRYAGVRQAWLGDDLGSTHDVDLSRTEER
jgi:hypothetical protein